MSRRVLVATFGSAGDVFPLVPVVQHLRDEGHDVRCAVPRALGLYLRAARLPMYSLGDGSEMRVLQDPHIVSTRFHGWASWRRTLLDYVAPTILDDLDVLDRIVDEWRPDVVVTSGFAVAARVAASRREVPRLEATIYPQHQIEAALARGGPARALRDVLAQHTGRTVDDEMVGEWLWGVGSDATLLLHDRALLGSLAADVAVIGFPYWDDAPRRPDDLDRMTSWLATSERPVVVVTLGSFLGARQRETWVDAATAVHEHGGRPLLVGPRGRWDDERLARIPDLLAVGFLPLSEVVTHASAIVHHGGIGTTFAALHAGCPAVVAPQAFDQSFNAGLVERAGAGLAAPARSVADAVGELMTTASYTTSARELAARLVPSKEATMQLGEHILQRAGQAAGATR